MILPIKMNPEGFVWNWILVKKLFKGLEKLVEATVETRAQFRIYDSIPTRADIIRKALMLYDTALKAHKQQIDQTTTENESVQTPNEVIVHIDMRKLIG